MESRDISSGDEKEQPKSIICIHTPHDASFYDELQTHLKLWKREGYIQWLETAAGSHIEKTLYTNIQLADLILLLISRDFIANDFYYKAMETALQEKSKRQVPVVPVLARPASWKESACGSLRALPDNEQPIERWDHPEEAYESIRKGLARLASGFSFLKTTRTNRPPLFRVPDLPKEYVPRPKEFHGIKSELLERCSDQTTAIKSAALLGAGGFGKTMLANALCHDAEIQEAFPDGILWIKLTEQSPPLLAEFNSLLTFLDPSYADNEVTTLYKAQEHWQTTLQDRQLLLVIDDVWEGTALKPWLEGGPQCMRLITTRNDKLLSDDTKRVRVDAMKQEEAITMLIQGRLSDGFKEKVYETRLMALVKRLGYMPLLLTLAHGLLKDFVNHGEESGDALTMVEQKYQTYGITDFRQDNVEERQRTVENCLEVSLRHMEDKDFMHPRYHASQRYRDLAIFPEDTDIPLATIQTYWHGRGSLTVGDSRDLCIRLYDLSLLLDYNPKKGTIRLHDVFRSCLLKHTEPDLPALHVSFLDASQQVLDLNGWAGPSPEAMYLWQFLIWHLSEASRYDELQTTLSDLRFLVRKAFYIDISYLEEDFLRARECPPASAMKPTGALLKPFRRTIERFNSHLPRWLHPLPTVEPAVSNFELLYQTISGLSHLLRQTKTPADKGGLLLSHLGEKPAFAEQLHLLEQKLPRPFLTAWHSLPGVSSPSLLRTLTGHIYPVTICRISSKGHFIASVSIDDGMLKVWDASTGKERFSLSLDHKITDCAICPDETWIISALSDGTLKVWDVATGVERFSLRGHTQQISRCAVSPDGDWIVSASADRTLKIWDASTGIEHFTLTGHTDPVADCVISPDGRFIVSVSLAGILKVWDAVTGAERFTLPSYISYNLCGFTPTLSSCCAVSPDGRFIVARPNTNVTPLKVWDAITGEERLTLTGHADGYPIGGCAVSPDGCWIVSASHKGTLKVWNARTGKERFILKGHTDAVWCCRVSPNGRFIVSASSDGTLKVWDIRTGVERLTLTGHSWYVADCAVSPDGSFIVSASADGTLKVWDASREAKRPVLEGHTDHVNDCAVSPDGCWTVSASDDFTLKLWNSATGREQQTLTGHSEKVNGCAFSSDGTWMVSASDDATLKLWDTASGINRLTIKGHIPEINGCAISPDGDWMVSASDDSTLKVWRIPSNLERFTLKGHTQRVNGCAISPDGGWMVSASDDRTLKIWDSSTGKERLTLSGHAERVNACVVVPYRNWIVSASDDHTLKIWDSSNGTELFTLKGHTDKVNSCAVSQFGDVIVSASDDHTLKVWDKNTGKERFTLKGHADKVNDCALSLSGDWIVSASDDHTLKVWETATGGEHFTLRGHTGKVTGCVMDSMTEWIFSASADHTLKIWSTRNGEEVQTLTGHTDQINSCSVSTRLGKVDRVVSASRDGTLRVWWGLLEKPFSTCPGHASKINDCAISPDGCTIVSAFDDHTLAVWDARTGAERLTLSGHTGGVNGCAVSPDGMFIVSASSDSTLKVWDATTGVEHFTLSGHTGSVNGCAVSPNGSYIVSASSDSTLKVWDAATGVERFSLSGHTLDASGCAFSPDNRWIASTSWDNRLKLWNVQTGECVLTFPVDDVLTNCTFYPDGKHLAACGRKGVYFWKIVV